MKRVLAQFEGKQFDVLIIGGGIYGVCAAWDAALRGLSVALIEKNDFGSATSSNSLKIIHGGLRYLQHADFKRMRESITERSVLMRIAPHLVHPLPCIMPTYGHGLKSKELMAVALYINDVVGFDRNRSLASEKHIPRGKVISKEECKEIIPGISAEGLTGGAIWYDCQVQNSERMLFSILHSAIAAGAVAANYVEMTGFVTDVDCVKGVKAKDNLTGEEFEIRSKLVINNAGPWFNHILHHMNGRALQTPYKLSAAMNLVIKKKLFPEFAVGVYSHTEFKDEDALISKGSRLLFVTPWGNHSLIGTTHVHYEGGPGEFRIREQDIQAFVDEVNTAYPPAELTRNDVAFFYGGLLPMAGVNEQTGDVKLLKNYQIIDHKKNNGLDGLLSVVGVKFTTARDVAEKTIDYTLKKLGKASTRSPTSHTPVFGGDLENLNDFISGEKSKAPNELSENSIEHLVRNYGTEYLRVVNYAKDEWAGNVIEDSEVLKAEIIHSVRDEMAMKLSDVVRRRTELGSAGNPGESALKICAKIMAQELSWDEARMQKEIDETKAVYVPAS